RDPADPDPRRSAVEPRQRERSDDPGRPEGAAQGPDDVRHRAPPVHDPERGPDSRPRSGRDRRARDARGAAGQGGTVPPAVRQAVPLRERPVHQPRRGLHAGTRRGRADVAALDDAVIAGLQNGRMAGLRRLAGLLAALVVLPAIVSADGWIDEYRAPATRLINEATRDHFAWNRLAVLTDTIGHRLSGSPQLDRAIAWAVAEMTRDGLENVHTEKVMVPKWVR